MAPNKKQPFGAILRESDDGWYIAASTQNAAGNSTEGSTWQPLQGDARSAKKLAAATAEFLDSQGLTNKIAVMLAANSTLSAKFTVANASDLRDRRSLAYQFEELLPLAAEDFVADFMHEGKQVLGLATPVSELLPVLEAFEEAELHVQSIAPTALLAVQTLLDDKAAQDVTDTLVWKHENGLHVVRLGERVTDWQHLASDAQALTRCLAAQSICDPGSRNVALIDMPPALAKQIRQQLASLCQMEVVDLGERSFLDDARQGAVAVLAGKSSPWCELRRDKLATGDPHRTVRREWQWCQWAMAILLLCAAFFFFMRGRQYESMTGELNQSQGEIFQSLFPKSKAPSAVVSRLTSERTKLAGARGKEAAVEQPASALTVMYELLSGLPEDLRLQVQQLRVEDGKVYVDANVRTVGHAGELADALEQQGFEVEPPTTEQYDAKQVSVRINGVLPSPGIGGNNGS